MLRVIARMNLGGPAHHVATLCRGLDGDRYRSLLACGRAGPGEAEHTDLDGIALTRIDALAPEIHPLRDLIALLALVRTIRRFRPAIVETHTAKAGMLGRLAALLAVRPRPVVIHTYHGHVLRGYFGPAKTAGYRLAERLLGKASDALVAVSEATAEELVDLGIAPREKFAVLPLGLELDEFFALEGEPDPPSRDALGIGSGELVFTYTGRLVPIKRLDVMVRALASARRSGLPARLLLIGDGPMRPRLEALALELECADSVAFLGYRRDLARIAAASDAALLSSDNEGTPVSLIEAGAAARPSVATRVGGVADVVVEGTGLLAASGDPEAIAAQIVRLGRDGERRREMGERARKHVRERFSAPRLLHDADALYTRLLAGAAPR